MAHSQLDRGVAIGVVVETDGPLGIWKVHIAHAGYDDETEQEENGTQVSGAPAVADAASGKARRPIKGPGREHLALLISNRSEQRGDRTEHRRWRASTARLRVRAASGRRGPREREGGAARSS